MGADFGKHTIAAWGRRLKVPKLHEDIEDWSKWTPEMHERCIGDVQTALRMWQYLNPDAYSQTALVLEHRVARLTRKITEAGWPFDMKKATDLHVELIERREAVQIGLREQFTGWEKITPFTPKRNDAKRGYVKDQVFLKKSFVPFNINSRAHITRALKELGWEPTEFTDNGSPKMDDEIIDSVAAIYPQAEGLSNFLMLNKRIAQLADGDAAWLKHVGADGRIHGEYNPMGTVTSRASHYRPNLGQVPASSSPFGHECRELFCVPEGWDAVGADMSGLELRCLAHYIAKYDGGAYGTLILEGDVHWVNTIAMGLLEGLRDKDNQLHTITREQGAKRGLYAWLYGAGDEKVGRLILDLCRLLRKTNPDWEFMYRKFFGDDQAPKSKALKAVGRGLKEKLLSRTDGLADLVSTVKEKAEVGNGLPGLDGRRLPVRSPHSALNTLLQSCGAILCKRWICDSYDALIADGLKWGWDGDFVFLGWIHDELQIACRSGLGDRIGKMLTRAAQEAGTAYKFRIKLDSEYKIGKTWADTH
jgi:DNA polymerase-1